LTGVVAESGFTPSPTQWLHLGWTRRVVHLAA